MIIVAADGSGDFTSVQTAIDSIPDESFKLVTIYIQEGIYIEKLHIRRDGIRLVGENRNNTIISFADYAKKQFDNGEYYHTFHSYSAFIGADDFQAKNITFANTAGYGEDVGQALAAYIDGDRIVFKNCGFVGYQDTLFTAPLPPAPLKKSAFGGPNERAVKRKLRQYYEGCYIEGDVDFIFGSATAFFHRCEIYSKKRRIEKVLGKLKSDQNLYKNGWITAASTPLGLEYGYVFMNCKLTGDATEGTVYLGRPWRNNAKVTFLDC